MAKSNEGSEDHDSRRMDYPERVEVTIWRKQDPWEAKDSWQDWKEKQ